MICYSIETSHKNEFILKFNIIEEVVTVKWRIIIEDH